MSRAAIAGFQSWVTAPSTRCGGGVRWLAGVGDGEGLSRRSAVTRITSEEAGHERPSHLGTVSRLRPPSSGRLDNDPAGHRSAVPGGPTELDCLSGCQLAEQDLTTAFPSPSA